MADLKKGARITGTQRDKLASDLKKKYEKGASIRALAESTGRSYGFVHRVLSESGWRCGDAAAPPGPRRRSRTGTAVARTETGDLTGSAPAAVRGNRGRSVGRPRVTPPGRYEAAPRRLSSRETPQACLSYVNESMTHGSSTIADPTVGDSGTIRVRPLGRVKRCNHGVHVRGRGAPMDRPWGLMRAAARGGRAAVGPPGTSAGSGGSRSPYRRWLLAFLLLTVVGSGDRRGDPGAGRSGRQHDRGGRAGVGRRGDGRRAGRRDRGAGGPRGGQRAGVAVVLRPHRRGPDRSTCARPCTRTCSGCRWRSSPAPAPGALVSRLNNDVIGAQSAITSTLASVVTNVIQLDARRWP